MEPQQGTNGVQEVSVPQCPQLPESPSAKVLHYILPTNRHLTHHILFPSLLRLPCSHPTLSHLQELEFKFTVLTLTVCELGCTAKVCACVCVCFLHLAVDHT